MKILIAGAGHGGLTAAAYLSEKGYDVHVYEKLSRDKLGYDWDDAMHGRTFEYAGIKDYDPKDVIPRKKSAFYSTSLKTPILFEYPEGSTFYEIERKVLYKYLLENAENKGAKLHFNTKVDKALIEPAFGKVAGLIIDGVETSGDLVIDSAGMFSPVRDSLPENYNIINKFKDNEIFHTYRAIFNLKADEKITNGDKFNIYFKFNNINGIAWYKIVNGYSDVLIGSTNPLTMDEINEHLVELRKVQPSIGDKLVRAGKIYPIPLRAAFSNIVGDNYAAIGDTVSMTVPINGSGISNSILAGKLLSETITSIDLGRSDSEGYTKENLWDYQVKYMKTVGANMISIDMIKRCLLSFQPKVIDFLFDASIITENELRAGTLGIEIPMSFKDMLEKLKKGYKKLPTLIKLSQYVANSKKAKAHALTIPSVYNKEAVESWVKKYESFLK